jgi:hypothetical protein
MQRSQLLMRPGVSQADIDEYKSLRTQEITEVREGTLRRRRLEELYQKLHGSQPKDPVTARDARLGWIQSNEFTGDADGIMQQLLDTLPTTTTSFIGLTLAMPLMAELWLRGLPKEHFMLKMKLTTRRRKRR